MAAKKTAKKKRASRRKPPTLRVLTAEEILSSKDCAPIRVSCPEWGGVVYIKPMTADDRDEYDQDQYRSVQERAEKDGPAANLASLRARTVAACACNAKGVRLFTMDQVEALGKKNGAVLDRLWTVAAKANKLNKADVDELAGN